LRRTLAVILLATILLLCVGLFADSDSEAEAARNGADEAVTTVALPDSTINLINTRYRAIEPIVCSSCYDCHSASTEYPWYHNLPIISGMLDDHIKEGREHLDFTDGFPFGGKEDQAKLLEEMREEIEEGKMPILSYRLMHWGRLIEGTQRDSVFTWIDETISLLQIASGPKN
jgi:hypothetical protein